MDEAVMNTLKARLGEEDYQKLTGIDNLALYRFIAQYLELCNPSKVFVSTGSPQDAHYIREAALKGGDEKRLAIAGHTIHFEGYYDLARDRGSTKILLPKGVDLGPHINTMDRDEGLGEIHALLKNIMQGHELFVLFCCLGPTNSEFSMPCVQLTDSSYVAHSENLLYRTGYEEFKRLGPAARFFKFVHSAGELEGAVSKNTNLRRIYIDLDDDIVFSANTQYGGNTLGLKKLAMRLAIYRGSQEGWLTEHMFIMGVHGPGGRVTYLTGGYPSLCGKTSTSMVDGETIVGDDIAYLRTKDGRVRAANVEVGVFGIIEGVNSKDDPLIWKALTSPGEIIFSNVLVTEDGGVHWVGKDEAIPQRGVNHSGEWAPGKRDAQGNEIPPSHSNARFTLELKLFENLDSRIDDPEGVEVGGIVYGGRDSDTWVPVEESFDWVHGIITKGASLESETTAATLGQQGARQFNPMSNLDFLSIPIGQYVESNLRFGSTLENPPPVFGVNYFLRDRQGSFLNDKADKRVWLKWMELRAHNEVAAIVTPTGLIPTYEDLQRLFKDTLGKDYSQEDYIKQFTTKVPENLAKIDRIMTIYQTQVHDTPPILFEVLEEQRQRLVEARQKYDDYISPEGFGLLKAGELPPSRAKEHRIPAGIE